MESTGGVANELMRHHRLKLPRIDTIDLLKNRDAKAVQHTTMV